MATIIWEKEEKDNKPHEVETKEEEKTEHIKCTVKRRTFKVSEQRE